MSHSIYLLLEVPSEHASGMSGPPGSQADLQRLLARSRLRLVSRNAGQLPPPETATQAPVPMPQEQGDAGEAVKSLEEVERDYIVEILSRSGGNRSKAARMLNISRRTLQRKMARLG